MENCLILSGSNLGSLAVLRLAVALDRRRALGSSRLASSGPLTSSLSYARHTCVAIGPAESLEAKHRPILGFSVLALIGFARAQRPRNETASRNANVEVCLAPGRAIWWKAGSGSGCIMMLEEALTAPFCEDQRP